MEKHHLRQLIHLGILTALLPLAGCIVYSSDVTYGGKGKPVSDRTLDQIETGTTTRDWLLATLGEPSDQRKTPDGVEILEYSYSRKKDNSFVFLPFVIVNDENETRQTVYFEIRRGIVTNFWTETSRH
jgi:outer membrane protein assembly factor BamE (lipoprotein component of BamABCDE complex)